MASINIFFNDVNISAIDGVQINSKKIHSMPTVRSATHTLSRTDGQKKVNQQYNAKEIVLEGYIIKNSRNEMEIARDNLMAKLTAINAKLEFEQAGALRRYYATVENVSIAEIKGGFAPFDIKFVCDDPYGYATALSTITMAGFSANNTTASITAGGSANALPYLNFTITTLTGGTAGEVSLINVESGRQISVVRNWVNGDNLIVDNYNQTVTVNGTAVDKFGQFLEFTPTIQTLKWTDTLTTRDVVLNSGTFLKRFI